MTYVIAQPCVDLKDKACIEECPVDCIYEGERMLYIHPDECVDCGACEPVCPVEAIYYEDDVPEQWKDYYKANVEFFDDLGSPGGAAKLGVIAKDHPVDHRAAAAGARRVTGRASLLPDFPWDRLAPYGHGGRAHPGGIVDLSVGTPVDPTPGGRQRRAARGAPTRPATRRPTAPRRCARPWRRWFARAPRRAGRRPRRRAADDRLQGAGRLAADAARARRRRRRRASRRVAYPTYDVGARLAGATPVAVDGHGAGSARRAAVRAGVAELAVQPDRRASSASSTSPRSSPGPARNGVVVASDECYVELGVDRRRSRAEHPRPARSAAGRTRACSPSTRCPSSPTSPATAPAFVAGDPALVGRLLEVRKHAGMIVPGPVQAAMVAALGDDAHVQEQRGAVPRAGAPCSRRCEAAGFRVDALRRRALPVGDAATSRPCDTVAWLADRGILVAPGNFYGAAGARHVRVALTATDERVSAAVERLR